MFSWDVYRGFRDIRIELFRRRGIVWIPSQTYTLVGAPASERWNPNHLGLKEDRDINMQLYLSRGVVWS